MSGYVRLSLAIAELGKDETGIIICNSNPCLCPVTTVALPDSSSPSLLASTCPVWRCPVSGTGDRKREAGEDVTQDLDWTTGAWPQLTGL